MGWCCSLRGAGTGILQALGSQQQPVLEELRAVTTQEQESWICLSSRRTTGSTGPALLHWLPLASWPSRAPAPSLPITDPPGPSLFGNPPAGRQELGRVPSTETIPQHRNSPTPQAILPHTVPSMPWLIHNNAVQTSFISASDPTTPSRKTKLSSQCQTEIVWSKGKKEPTKMQRWLVSCVCPCGHQAGRAVPRKEPLSAAHKHNSCCQLQSC